MKRTILFLILLISLGSCNRTDTVSLGSFLEGNVIDDDATLAFRRAIEYCRDHHIKVLEIPEGEYQIYPDLAFERYEFVTNNSADLKRILIDLDGMKDFELKGKNARLMLHGYVSAISVRNSKNIIIGGLSIDYARTFHSEGKITNAGHNTLDLEFSDAYPYRISNGDLHFCDERGAYYPVSHLLEFNATRREPEFRAKDYWLNNETLLAEQLPNGNVRIYCEDLTGKVGNILLLGPAHRLCPAVFIDHSENVLICNMNIYHCGGMGVVAQMTNNIELNQVHVLPAPNSDRVISITADATHFTHCGGYVKMIDCEFFNQVDDATNIHGMYGIIKQIVAPGRVRVFFPHEQQYGLNVLEPDVEVEILTQRNLITHTECRVKEMERLNKEWYEITLNGDLSKVKTGDLITRMQYPEVLIKNCRMGNNRARGFLLGSRKHTVVEDCYFHTPGTAILFEGDGYYWYEQAGVRDVIIRNNTFDKCMYGAKTWGAAVIATGNGPKEDRTRSAYNRNIIIEDNNFILIDSRLLNIYSTDNCVVQNNKTSCSDEYPVLPVLSSGSLYVTDESTNIRIKE